MKNGIIYILVSWVLFACQNEFEVEQIAPSGKTTLQVAVNIPEYRTTTRAASFENNLSDVWLLAFDSNGLFLERVQATDLDSREANGAGLGSFKAEVPKETGIIHVVANYDDWSSFNDKAFLQKDEKEVIPSLYSYKMVFWGRSEISSLAAPLSVTLFRNQAKVTVRNEASNFTVTGYALCNIMETGTVAPFIPDKTPNPFIIQDDMITLSAGTLAKISQDNTDCNLETKYMFENPNYFNDQSYLIIKGHLANGAELYYKIQFQHTDKKPYIIARNHEYRVIIKSFSQEAHGSASFEDAMHSEASNDIYAEIFKDSPTISDSENNRLTVSRLNVLFTQGGTLHVTAHYTENEIAKDAKISVAVLEDRNGIISVLSYNGNGSITANVARVYAGQYEATISVKAGKLSRTITILSSTLYSFAPVSFTPELYQRKDEEMTLSFRIPDAIPSYLYPLRCEIRTKFLYPIHPNKNLEVDFEEGIYKYVYWADRPGAKELKFQTSLDNSNETITIENDYFQTTAIDLVSRQFQQVSINSNNQVAYGKKNSAILRFTIPGYANYPPAYPLTVFVTTTKLTTSQAGWTAISGGYKYTYATPPSGEQTVLFTSSQMDSDEPLSISAAGFSKTTIAVESYLAQNVMVSGEIRIVQDRQSYMIPNYFVTSSERNLVDNFRVSRVSTYNFSVKTGSKLSDTVTFTSSNYTGTISIRQLLAGERLNLY